MAAAPSLAASPWLAASLRRCLGLGLLVAFAGALGCSDTQQPIEPRNLDRPNALTFACYGDLRLIGDDGPDASDIVVASAQPISSCTTRSQGSVPAGQGIIDGAERNPSSINFYGFLLQSLPGTVAVVYRPTDLSGGAGGAVLDTDDLTPGKNAIPIGVQPVDIATDRAGCHVITANAGSCDLSVLEVASAVNGDDRAVVNHIAVTASAGVPVLAKPAAMIAEPAAGDLGAECPAEPTGQVWIAYPSCHLVALVQASSGEVVAGVQFAADGTAAITDGAVSCAAECGAAVEAPVDPLAARPATLALTAAGDRLVIGAENSPILTIVELADDGLPLSLSRVPLEGDLGVLEVAVSEVIEQGGSSSQLGGSGGQFQYVYAIGTDETVRVADIFGLNVECDTQVDPRYFRSLTDVGLLSCFPVGDPATPPRRAEARTPGFQLTDGVPLDVAIMTVPGKTQNGQTQDTPQSPDGLVGTFAFVTVSTGKIFIINIDDDNYPDFEQAAAPLAVDLQLGMAHQPRDLFGQRDAVSEGTVTDDDGTTRTVPLCNYPSLDFNEGGPRLGAPIAQAVAATQIATAKIGLLPFVRNLACDGDDSTGPVSELSFMAPVEVREQTFPSWLDVRSEQWFVSWEGSLSLDTASVNIDGPAVRQGVVDVGGTGMHLLDDTGPFCAAGVEPYDFVILRGCDPSRGNEQCGVAETCYVHPDAVASAGHCLPTSQVDALAAVCGDFLLSRRRYTVTHSDAGDLELGERWRTLRTTPVEGCLSDDECQAHYVAEQQLIAEAHPKDFELPAEQPTWACEPDRSRAPGPDRCLMTCASNDDCEDGFACSDGHCNEGPIPPRQCITTAQRYELHAGEGFAVVGEVHGYLHDRIEDPATGACIADPAASPLLRGRIPLVAPPCIADGPSDVTPNPCQTTVEHDELTANYDDDGSCTAPTGELGVAERTRETTAIRFQNPAFRFHLVDPTITGDAVCSADRAGALRPFPAVFAGYQLSFAIRGGFISPASLSFDDGRTGDIRSLFTAIFPTAVVPGPDGGLWIVDEGDLLTSLISTRGQLFRVDPDGFYDKTPLKLQ